MSSDINFVTFMMSSDSNFETSMMSIDIHFVAFMMISDFCLFDIPVDLVSPGMLQYAVGCRAYLFSVVGSFRVNVLADAESVFFVVVFWHFRENGNRWCSDKLNKHTLIYSIVV